MIDSWAERQCLTLAECPMLNNIVTTAAAAAGFRRYRSNMAATIAANNCQSLRPFLLDWLLFYNQKIVNNDVNVDYDAAVVAIIVTIVSRD